MTGPGGLNVMMDGVLFRDNETMGHWNRRRNKQMKPQSRSVTADWRGDSKNKRRCSGQRQALA